jgi:hypothetical protein
MPIRPILKGGGELKLLPSLGFPLELILKKNHKQILNRSWKFVCSVSDGMNDICAP